MKQIMKMAMHLIITVGVFTVLISCGSENQSKRNNKNASRAEQAQSSSADSANEPNGDFSKKEDWDKLYGKQWRLKQAPELEFKQDVKIGSRTRSTLEEQFKEDRIGLEKIAHIEFSSAQKGKKKYDSLTVKTKDGKSNTAIKQIDLKNTFYGVQTDTYIVQKLSGDVLEIRKPVRTKFGSKNSDKVWIKLEFERI